MRINIDENIKKSAYKKPVDEMTFNELAAILITTDGKGERVKKDALSRIIEICGMTKKK